MGGDGYPSVAGASNANPTDTPPAVPVIGVSLPHFISLTLGNTIPAATVQFLEAEMNNLQAQVD